VEKKVPVFIETNFLQLLSRTNPTIFPYYAIKKKKYSKRCVGDILSEINEWKIVECGNVKNVTRGKFCH